MVNKTLGMKVDDNLRGYLKNIWMDCVKEDMRREDVSKEITYDRPECKNICCTDPPNSGIKVRRR